MTSHRRLRLLVLAAALGGCVPTQRAIRGQSHGAETWSWRMSATEGRWSTDPSHPAARPAAARPAAGEEVAAPAPEPEATADDAEMTLEPDPVAPAKKPKALVARTSRAKRSEPVVDLETSDSDEEFVNKIIDGNADAEDGEITMSAMELPKSKAERAAARKKLSAPVVDIVPDVAKTPAPAKKKHMTRAEKRRAKLMAKLEKKKAKEMAAREARLRGQRARIDEEERQRVSSARKDKRKKRKGKFFKNGEGFIDDEGASDDSDDEEAAASDDDEDDDASGDDDDSGDDESDDDDSVVVVTSKKKAKPTAAPVKPAASKPAPRGKAAHVKSDWRGQAIDDEDPLKAKKK